MVAFSSSVLLDIIKCHSGGWQGYIYMYIYNYIYISSYIYIYIYISYISICPHNINENIKDILPTLQYHTT